MAISSLPIKVDQTLIKWPVKVMCHSFIVCFIGTSSVFAEIAEGKSNAVQSVTFDHVISWTLGLVVVIAIFLGCVWLMRKTGALKIQSKENMKIISGLSLGMRERLILVQVGEKQLLLGVTPGRIDNLLILEGDDQILNQAAGTPANKEFAKKLRQFMPGVEDD